MKICHRKDEFHQCIENNSTLRSAIITTEEVFEIVNVLSIPCPSTKGAERQRYYRIRNKYIVKELLNTKFLYELHSPSPLRVVAKEELFDLFERVYSEGGKHLGRDRLFAELKS